MQDPAAVAPHRCLTTHTSPSHLPTESLWRMALWVWPLEMMCMHPGRAQPERSICGSEVCWMWICVCFQLQIQEPPPLLDLHHHEKTRLNL